MLLILRNNQNRQCYLFCLLWVLLFFCACHRSDNVRIQTANVDGIESYSVSNYVVSPVSDTILLFQSYSLSMPFVKEGKNRIMVYDDRQHALDVFCDSDFLYRIHLQRHGNNAIKGKVQSFMPISEDSVWIYDRVAFYLINRSGKVLCEHKDEDDVILGSNYAMHTAHMGWQDNGVLLYPTRDDNLSIKVKFYDSRKDEVIDEVNLSYPACNPKGDKKYPYMDFPNVTFSPNRIIYNFPYEDNIHVIDLSTAENQEYAILSEYSDGVLPLYNKGKTFTDYMQYNWGNKHFYEVSYLRDLNIYVRPMLGASDLEQYGNAESVVDVRKLYLTFLDDRFNTIGEMELKEHRYSNFHGWCALTDGVAVYVDNLLGGHHEELVYDVIKPVLK